MPDKIPLGKPLTLTDADLDELSKITPGDIKKAREFWHKNAPDNFTDLLDADLVDVEE